MPDLSPAAIPTQEEPQEEAVVTMTIPDPTPSSSASPSEIEQVANPEAQSQTAPEEPTTSDETAPATEPIATQEAVVVEEPPKEIIRNEKGQIVKGVAQDTNKNGTAGRPCLLCQKKEEFMGKAEAYLERCRKGMNGRPIIPYIEELAMEMNTIDENIVNWAKKTLENGEPEHPEFLTIYQNVRMIQKLRLKQRALGRYNPVGALTLLRFDHGAVEVNKQVIAGSENEPIQIEIIEEVKRLPDNE
jgi:hypothetical protein